MPNIKTFDADYNVTTYAELVQGFMDKGYDFAAYRSLGAWAMLAQPYSGPLAQRWEEEIEPLLFRLKVAARERLTQRRADKTYTPFDANEIAAVAAALTDFPDWRNGLGLPPHEPKLD